MTPGLRRDSAFAFSVYQRKPPEELHLGERLQGGFLPPTGRIPPDSGGWHRDLFCGSVAGALTTRPLSIMAICYNMKPIAYNGTKVLMVPVYRGGSVESRTDLPKFCQCGESDHEGISAQAHKNERSKCRN